MTGRSVGQKAELVRSILLSPPEDTNDQIAARFGASREWVRRVRIGVSSGDLFPELPRIGQTGRRTCNHCVHWEPRTIRLHNLFRRNGFCGIGIPEALEIGIRHGIGCGAFSPSKKS
jgi:hypothetical protein